MNNIYCKNRVHAELYSLFRLYHYIDQNKYFLLLLLKNSPITRIIATVVGTRKSKTIKKCIIIHLNSKYDNINLTYNENTLIYTDK